MRRRGGTVAACVALAAAVRLLSAPAVAVGDDVRLVGGPDSYYHLRRAELAAAGRLGTFDAWTNFPAGQRVHWPRGYDLVLGAVLREFGARGVVLVPVVLGAATVAALEPWAARLVGGAAPYALLVLAVAPAAAYPSLLGALDHHAWEALAFVAALAAAAVGGRRGAAFAALAVAAGYAGAPGAPAAAAAAVLAFAAGALPSRPAAALLAVAAVATAAGLVEVQRVLYHQDRWMALAGEARPLLASLRDVPRSVVVLSPGFLLLPVLLPLWWRRRDSPAAAAALAAAALAIPMALAADRYTPYLAPVCALALADGVGRASRRYGRRPALLFALLALLPPLRGASEVPTWRPDPDAALAAALEHLRDRTPPAGDPLDAEAPPAYGVAAAWDLGHHVVALGRRGALANPFHGVPEGREAAHRILFSRPDEASAEADAAVARYVLLTDLLRSGYARSYRRPGDPPVAETLYGRLYLLGDETLGWRRVFASDERWTFEGRRVPLVQVWERLPAPAS